MDEDNNIEKKIRQSFDGLNKPAPEFLWNNLERKIQSDAEDKKIDFSIKSSFNQTEKVAPDALWVNINRQLNIDRVWKRIVWQLDRKPAIAWRRIAAVFLFLVSLTGGVALILSLNQNSDPYEGALLFPFKSKHFPTEVSSRPSTVNSTKALVNAEKTFTNQKSFSRNSQNNSKVSALPPSNDFLPSSSGLPLAFTKSNLLPILKLPETELVSNTHKVRESQLNIFGGEFQKPGPLDSTSFYQSTTAKGRFIEVGLVHSFTNTWIVNNDTKNGFDENSLIQNQSGYTNNFGITGALSLKANSALVTELFVLDKYVQGWDQYSEGKYFNKTLELNYIKLALLYQYKIKQSPYRTIPSHWTVMAGPYGSILKNYEASNDFDHALTLSKFSRTDFGIRVGLGQEKEFKSIVLGYGICLNQGIQNIFMGDSYASRDFNSTRTSAWGSYLNVKYRFSK